MVSLAALCPTIADMGGAASAAKAWGSPSSESFKSLLEGEDHDWKDQAVMGHEGKSRANNNHVGCESVSGLPGKISAFRHNYHLPYKR